MFVVNEVHPPSPVPVGTTASKSNGGEITQPMCKVVNLAFKPRLWLLGTLAVYNTDLSATTAAITDVARQQSAPLLDEAGKDEAGGGLLHGKSQQGDEEEELHCDRNLVEKEVSV
jgi:hypothetical protein